MIPGFPHSDTEEIAMKSIRIARIALLVSSFALTGALAAAVDPRLDAAMSIDGLVQLKTKDVDLAYTRPGATLSAYKKVMLDPIVSVWDCAALLPVVVEAGGSFTDWRGTPTIHAEEAIGTNSLVYEELMALIGEPELRIEN